MQKVDSDCKMFKSHWGPKQTNGSGKNWCSPTRLEKALLRFRYIGVKGICQYPFVKSSFTDMQCENNKKVGVKSDTQCQI